MSVNLSKVIALGPPKEAALYFERVLPFDLGHSLLLQNKPEESALYIPFNGGEFDRGVVESLIGHHSSYNIYLEMTNVALAIQFYRLMQDANNQKLFLEDKNTPEKLEPISSAVGIDLQAVAESIISGDHDTEDFAKGLGLKMTAISNSADFQDSSLWDVDGRLAETRNSGGDLAKYSATLSGLKLVDPSKATWEQIVEFRKDAKSFSALRDLRILFQTDYSGRDINFISDDLAGRIERFEEARKLWGFETIQRSLSVLFDEKSAIAASFGSIATHAIGGSLLAAVSAGGGIALGGAVLGLGKVYVEQRKQRIQSPVRYLVDLKDRLSNK